MGADFFETESLGTTPKEAFNQAVEDARYMDGHGGYTGTIAEKNSFVMITLPKGKDPYDYINELIEENDDRIYEKWGPAGCFELPGETQSGQKRFLFFGYASS